MTLRIILEEPEKIGIPYFLEEFPKILKKMKFYPFYSDFSQLNFNEFQKS